MTFPSYYNSAFDETKKSLSRDFLLRRWRPVGRQAGIRSGIILSPTLQNFHDPGSRFRVLAKHRSAFLILTKVPQGTSFSSSFTLFTAEMRGFEPLVEFPLRQFSKLLLSTTQPHLHIVHSPTFYCEKCSFIHFLPTPVLR